MSQPSRLRRPAIVLALAAAAVASIATSPPDTLGTELQSTADPITLTAEQPTATQRLRARLDLDKGIEGRDAMAYLQLYVQANYVIPPQDPDAGVPDAGEADAGPPPPVASVVELVIRDAAHPDVELFRGSDGTTLDLMRSCEQRTCEQTFILEWRLLQAPQRPVAVMPSARIGTRLDLEDGTATLELLP